MPDAKPGAPPGVSDEFLNIHPDAGKKTGCNFHDRNNIERLAGEGLKAEEIGEMLGIMASVVKKFMPKAGGKKKAAEE